MKRKIRKTDEVHHLRRNEHCGTAFAEGRRDQLRSDETNNRRLRRMPQTSRNADRRRRHLCETAFGVAKHRKRSLLPLPSSKSLWSPLRLPCEGPQHILIHSNPLDATPKSRTPQCLPVGHRSEEIATRSLPLPATLSLLGDPPCRPDQLTLVGHGCDQAGSD